MAHSAIFWTGCKDSDCDHADCESHVFTAATPQALAVLVLDGLYATRNAENIDLGGAEVEGAVAYELADRHGADHHDYGNPRPRLDITSKDYSDEVCDFLALVFDGSQAQRDAADAMIYDARDWYLEEAAMRSWTR